MLSKVVQLGLVELCRQVKAGLVLDVLQAGTNGWNDMVVCNSLANYTLQGGLASSKLLCNGLVVQEIGQILILVVLQDWLDQFGDVISLDDASAPPYLPDGTKVDVPAVFVVGLVDDVEALDVCAQARGINCKMQVFQEGLLIRCRELFWRGVEFEGVMNLATLGTI